MNEPLSLEVLATCQCGYYELPGLKEWLSKQDKYKSYGNVFHLEKPQGDIFIFSYGVIVFWNIPYAEQEMLGKQLTAFEKEKLDVSLTDEFTYSFYVANNAVGESDVSSSGFLLKNDHIQLPDRDIETRLALSHGIAQSTKLSQFENRVQHTISETENIPVSIAQTGTSRLGRKEVAKLRGKLYLTKSDILLNYDLLDVPDYFWENPELNVYYSRIANYLEIKQRVDVLEKKLETIHELLIMMADELKHKHSSLLEWIIIWLIAFEIAVFLVHDIFKWL